MVHAQNELQNVTYSILPEWARYNVTSFYNYLYEFDIDPVSHIPPHEVLQTLEFTLEWIEQQLPKSHRHLCEFLLAFFNFNREQNSHATFHVRPKGMCCNLDYDFNMELATMPVDFGNATFQCKACGAYLFEAETKIGKKGSQGAYSFCCNNGTLSTIMVPDHSTLPDNVKRLFRCSNNGPLNAFEKQLSNHFLTYINSFNNSISFATTFSTTEKATTITHPQRLKLNKTRGAYIAVNEGEITTTTGPPIHSDTKTKARYASVYFTPGIDEVEYRLDQLQHVHQSNNRKKNFTKVILDRLINTIKTSNPLYNCYKLMVDKHNETQTHYKVTFPSALTNDKYFPNPSDMASQFVSVLRPMQEHDQDHQATLKPIVITTNDNQLHTIPQQHQLYEPFTFLTLHLHSIQPTYHTGLRDTTGKKVSIASYYHYLLFTRDAPGAPMRHDLRFYTENLFHKYLLNAFLRIDDYRIQFHKHNMFLSVKGLDTVNNIRNELQRNKRPNEFGKRVIASNFQSSRSRYRKLTSAAMSLVSQIKACSLFITLTLNQTWPSIINNLKPNQSPSSRPDICSRVFKMYADFLFQYIKTEKPFGEIIAVVANHEYQTRGNPHQHASFFLKNDMTISLIDSTLSCELPCRHLQPRLWSLVTRFMIHPKHNTKNRLCLKQDNSCRFGFPQPFRSTTTYDPNVGFQLRRRDNGRTFERDGFRYSNADVVMYSPHLLLLLESHLNVQHCSSSTHVAYSLKYSLKCFRNDDEGGDTVFANVSNELTQTNEASQYHKYRFVTSPEASYRLIKNNKHTIIWPYCKQLNIHLEDNQSMTFNCNSKRIKLSSKATTSELTAYFKLVQKETKHPLPAQSLLGHPPATQLTFTEVAKHYTFNTQSKTWIRRKTYHHRRITYIRHIDVKQTELYHLRLILLSQPVMSFQHARTHQGHVYPTYVEAAKAKGLVDTHDTVLQMLQEASLYVSPQQLRVMFITLLTNSFSTFSVSELWPQVSTILAQDYAYQRCTNDRFRSQSDTTTSTPASFQQYLTTTNDDINNCLIHLQTLLKEHGKTLADYNLPIPVEPLQTETMTDSRFNAWLTENYNSAPILHDELDSLVSSLNDEQFEIFHEITTYCLDTNNLSRNDQHHYPDFAKNDNHHVRHIQGTPGMGKSYLINCIVHYLINQGQTVLCSSPSGIAATLLYCGSTMHSLFEIPLQINDTTTLNIGRQSFKYKLLQCTGLIVIDEISMSSCTVLSCLNRGLQALFNTDTVMASIPTLIVGDCTQIPPVIPRSSTAEVIAESFLFWDQWNYTKRKVYQLTTNVRLRNDSYSYSDFLCKLCWNKLPKFPSTGFGTNTIKIPWYITLQSKLQLPLSTPLAIQDLITWTFTPNNDQHPRANSSIDSTTIITPLNSDIHVINDLVLRQLAPQHSMTARIVSRHEQQPNQYGFVTYFATTVIHDQLPAHITRTTIEELRYQGMPLHQLNIAVGSPILLLRNIDKKRGLCNGTRLRVTKLLTNSIIAVILNGNKANIGTTVAIPRIDFQSKKNDTSLNVSFVRRQFPVTLAYAISINKSQGQTIERVGIYLPQPVFTHGMLTVAMSRVTNPDNLAVLIPHNNLIHGYTDAAPGKHDAGIYTPHIVYEPLLDFERNSSQDS